MKKEHSLVPVFQARGQAAMCNGGKAPQGLLETLVQAQLWKPSTAGRLSKQRIVVTSLSHFSVKERLPLHSTHFRQNQELQQQQLEEIYDDDVPY